MDRAEREDAVETAAERSAVGRATVPADNGHGTSDGAESSDNGRNDRAAVTAPARSGGAASGRAGVGSVLKPPSAAGSPANATTSPPGGAQPGASSTTRTVGTPSRPQRPPGLAVGTAPPTGSDVSVTPAGRVAEAVRSARTTVSAAAGRGPRRARLFVKRVDPWSVMKFSFAVSFVMFFVLIVATAVLYLALDQMNVFSHVNSALASLFPGSKSVKVTAGEVIGGAGGLGLVGVVLFTALSTLGAFVYNVCADLVGGIEVTLSERE
jgi:hypothetical protein